MPDPVLVPFQVVVTPQGRAPYVATRYKKVFSSAPQAKGIQIISIGSFKGKLEDVYATWMNFIHEKEADYGSPLRLPLIALQEIVYKKYNGILAISANHEIEGVASYEIEHGMLDVSTLSPSPKNIDKGKIHSIQIMLRQGLMDRAKKLGLRITGMEDHPGEDYLQKMISWLEKQQPPGPPPRPGLKWKPQTSRWIRPKDGEKTETSAKISDKNISEMADELEAKYRGSSKWYRAVLAGEISDKERNETIWADLERLQTIKELLPEESRDKLNEAVSFLEKNKAAQASGAIRQAMMAAQKADLQDSSEEEPIAEMIIADRYKEDFKQAQLASENFLKIMPNKNNGDEIKQEMQSFATHLGVLGEWMRIEELRDHWQWADPGSGSDLARMGLRTALNEFMGKKDHFDKDREFFTTYGDEVSKETVEEASNKGKYNAAGLIPMIVQTQRVLKARKMNSISIFRGLNGNELFSQISDAMEKSDEIGIPHSGVSSYSANKETALDFAKFYGGFLDFDEESQDPEHGIILEKKIPSSSVLLDFNAIGGSDFWEEGEVLVDGDAVKTFNASDIQLIRNPKVIEKQHPPGPPPRPGLIWKPQTSRWIRPKEGEAPIRPVAEKVPVKRQHRRKEVPVMVRPEEGQKRTSGDIPIPPGWVDVWVNPDPNGKLQTTGLDKAGRKQYKHSKKHSEEGSAEKYMLLKQFVKAHDGIIKKIRKKMNTGDDAAFILYLIHKTGFRVGSDKETLAAKQAFGASTLLGEHIKIRGNKVSFAFIAKKGVEARKTIQDKVLAEGIAQRIKGDDQPIFDSSYASVLAMMKDLSKGKFTPKVFRTYHGTNIALREVAGRPVPQNKKEFEQARQEVAIAASEWLGNTPGVALEAYIAPEVWSPWIEALERQ